ncbi:xanthine phosphoribosyltransferase [Sinanaerobacter chloroacetimidivorans]|uniref:Xanthine phosphoribosyltransferase n=1 Tax=Sinanaerobacter chloroacetimidivorans TaxID=2818044 RepID=A0A8J7VYK6_9FIRM|nr:xanthine phosphoribosyltransferase [Sinanaerobacter chloroacetimidivorans]MBR0597497.1 xanthine phosphoribosyltransferase [Sinanaerobacter chloroacetimidivorans]
MKALKDRIEADGVAIGTEIVKVDSFLNHQIDVALVDEIGKEFERRFHGQGVTKILTVEASGIAIACMAAKYFGNVPVVFAKKATPNTMTEDFYGAEVKSFTKGITSIVKVSKKYISQEDRILILDDFLAHGEAAIGMAELVKQAGAELVGIGAVIEKRFQGGSHRLKEKGYHVESLAIIDSIKEGKINFL